MTSELCPVHTVEKAAENIYVLTFVSERIAASVVAGQFVNIRTDDRIEPLLRRPFSIYNTENDLVRIIFNVVGRGTASLSRKEPGETIDVLGPLGNPFSLDGDSFETAVLVGGGLGVAPLPLAARGLQKVGKSVVTLLGARNASMLVSRYLPDVRVATDDGSQGYHGTVVDLASTILSRGPGGSMKLFSCGPTPMLRALQSLVLAKGIPCQASLEGAMGCGFGICQGCPVELAGPGKKYALMCKDGPVFDMTAIRL